MVTIVRDRIQDMVKRNLTLEQVQGRTADARLRHAVRIGESSSSRPSIRASREDDQSGVSGKVESGKGKWKSKSASATLGLMVAFIAYAIVPVLAQPPGPPQPPRPAKAAAPVDLTGLLGVGRQRGLALANGDAAQGRLREHSAEREGRKMVADAWDPGARRARRAAVQVVRRSGASCECRAACTSPGRTTRR